MKNRVKKLMTFVNEHKADILQWFTLITIVFKTIDWISDEVNSRLAKLSWKNKDKIIDVLEEMEEAGYATYKDPEIKSMELKLTGKMAYEMFVRDRSSKK